MPTSVCTNLAAAVALAMSLLTAGAGAQTPPSPAQGGQAGAGRQQTLTLPAPAQPAKREPGSVTFIGNATVIIRYGGLTILTDPNFLHKGDHVHLGYGLTSERLTDPAIDFDKLPPIDLVLLSHLHGDHFDHLVEKKLKRDMPIVTTADGAAGLEQLGFINRYGLNTWDTLTVTRGDTTLRINAMPGRHGPPVLAGLLPDVMGSMLEFSVANGNDMPPYRMYISGDTLVYDDIQNIPRRYPDIDLALLHLGGTRILGVMKVTMDGEDGVRMMQIIAPHHAIPIHYNDYTVFKSPLSDFQKAVTEAGLQDKVTYLKHGDTYRFRPREK
ncbi:MBL fold metallo-hydrolase [Noviherbaspirillum sp.]|uniref:MBL fold metallo-hydrolase n=1 Tax=Noviherbaspirillum sp. TaxID=1926288 RepID=UPI002FE25EF3